MSAGQLKLIQEKLGITPDVMLSAVESAKKNSILLHTALENMGVINNSKILEVFASLYGVKPVSLDKIDISSDVLRLIPKKMAEDFKMIPVDRNGNNIIVAMTNPKDVNASEQVRFQTNCFVRPVFALESDINKSIMKV